MFDHVTIRVSDREDSERFYDTVLLALGIEKTYSAEDLAEWGDFSLAAATDEKPVTGCLHTGFVAPARTDVDEFHRVGTGGRLSRRRPARRAPAVHFGGFLLDPDGNNVEIVSHNR